MSQNTRLGDTPVLAGAFLLILSSAFYSYLQRTMGYLSPEREQIFQILGYMYLIELLLGFILIAQGLLRWIRRQGLIMKNSGDIPIRPWALLVHLLSEKAYFRAFVVATVSYGIFYAFVTSMIVYQPGVDSPQAYLASIPSVVLVPCCGPPLYAPVLVVYLTNHLGLLLIPLSVILLVVVSLLVGMNVMLSTFAYRNRGRSNKKGWLAGLGAAVGIFTGCPTCAGLFFTNLVGGAGAVAVVSLLANYQPLFIGASIPLLAASPVLVTRSLRKVFKEGCITRGRENK